MVDPSAQYNATEFVWNAATFNCVPGSIERRPSLQSGGFNETESLVLWVDSSQFDYYQHQAILDWSSTLHTFDSARIDFSEDTIRNPNVSPRLTPQPWQIIKHMGRDWLIEAITFDNTGAGFVLNCVNPHAIPA